VIVYLGIGSNIDPEINLLKALNLLAQSVKVLAISTHYRTAPLAGRSEQADYINGVWEIETDRSFDQLKTLLQEIESVCGRVRSEDTYASRPIDLDILLFDDFVDEDLFMRPFLSYSLMELAPNQTVSNPPKSITTICKSMAQPSCVAHSLTTHLREIVR